MKLTKRQKRQLLRLGISLLILIVAFLINTFTNPPATINNNPGPGFYEVIEVEDGDTITIRMDGKSERVRFIGIDTPETQDPRKPVQCFGKAASDYTRNLVGNNPVRLEADSQSDNRDRYDRLLRYVYLPDGRMLQTEILRGGYGFAYVAFPFSKMDEFVQLQDQARQENRGLWHNCQPEKNQHGGYTSNPAD